MQHKYILLSTLPPYNLQVSGSHEKKFLYINSVNMSVFKYSAMKPVS